jgi:hypothetical protein
VYVLQQDVLLLDVGTRRVCVPSSEKPTEYGRLRFEVLKLYDRVESNEKI